MNRMERIGQRCRIYGLRAKAHTGYRPELWDKGRIVAVFSAGVMPFFLLRGGAEIPGYRVRLENGKTVTVGWLDVKIATETED